ncbi:MAG: 4a-hydroxytetrahydrobiopterin dehydratase [Chloroflexota bacterium]|nr:4a-hydroxytetrahydrobiopterin dehydratase [Chloroflexota bacterium]
MARLHDGEIAAGLAGLTSWQREGETITRTLKLADFAEAVALVNRVAAAAEAANHHPDICIRNYNRVTLTLTSHDAGGLTRRDLRLAGQIDEIAGG